MINKIFEGYIYRDKSVILYDYFTFLAKCKLIHEKIPYEKREDVERYLDDINNAMDFVGKERITFDELDPNPAKRACVKGLYL